MVCKVSLCRIGIEELELFKYDSNEQIYFSKMTL